MNLSATCAEAYAAPPRLHVRAASRLEARAMMQPSAPPWRVDLRGVLLDDASDPIANQPMAVELRQDGQDAQLTPRWVGCSANAVDATSPRATRTTTETDDAGRFCLQLSDWESKPEGLRLGIIYSGNTDYDASEATITVDSIQRVVTLDFVPPPRRLALEKPSHSLRVQTAVEPPYAEQELADKLELDLLVRQDERLDVSHPRLLAQASVRAGQGVSLDVRSTDLGPAGSVTLLLRARPSPGLAPIERTVQVLKTALVSLSLKAAPTVKGPTDPVELVIEARAGATSVPNGVVEATIGEARVTAPVLAGLARPEIRLDIPRGGKASVTLRYLAGSPWWQSGSPLKLEIGVPRANPWSQTPWIIAAGLVLLWLSRSWWRPRPAPQPGEHRLSHAVTGRPALEVVGRSTNDGSWTGIVLDAHEGTPLADVTVTASWPAFQGYAAQLGAVTDQTGAFRLVGTASGTSEGATLEVRSPSHARLNRPLPPPGTLRVALVSRRRALLDTLVRWARRRGHPWWRRGEPTPAQVAREARAQEAPNTTIWAEAIQAAAFGPNAPSEGQEEALAEPRAQARATDPVEGVTEETPPDAARR